MTKWLLTPYGSLSHRAFCNLTISQNSGGAVWTGGGGEAENTKRLLGARQCAHTQLCSTAPHTSQVHPRCGGAGQEEKGLVERRCTGSPVCMQKAETASSWRSPGA